MDDTWYPVVRLSHANGQLLAVIRAGGSEETLLAENIVELAPIQTQP